MAKRGRLETPEFQQEIQQHISLKVWDEICEGLLEFIDNHLEAFPKIGDSENRLALTDEFYRDRMIPPLEIWFKISKDDQTLILLGATLEDDTTLDDEFIW